MIEYYGVTCDQCAGKGIVLSVEACEKCCGAGTIPILMERPGVSRRLLRFCGVTMLVVAAVALMVLVHYR